MTAYTETQIKAGLKACRAGKTNREVAEAAGVKSPQYFAFTLRRREAEVIWGERAAA